MAIFSDHTQNSQYTHDKATHLGCLILSGAPQATKPVFFCGSLNISLFILSGTASGGEMENAFHARMTNRPVIHSRLCKFFFKSKTWAFGFKQFSCVPVRVSQQSEQREIKYSLQCAPGWPLLCAAI